MRIISSFRDYYDCILKYDEDRKTIWHREPRSIELQGDFYSLGEGYFHSCPEHGKFLIKVANKLYPVLFCTLTETKLEGRKYFHYCYNQEELAYNLLLTKEGTKFLEGKKYKDYVRFFDNQYEVVNQVGDCPVAEIWKGDWNFGKHQYNTKIQLNTCLTGREFYRVKGADQAYQEIRMFVEGMAQPEKPIPYIDDITMAQAKGFDKYSFRKDKSKK